MAYEMTIKERLRKYVSFLSIPRNEFEMRIKSAGGFLSNNSEPSGKLLISILSKYPDLSAEWLMRGEGEMIRKTVQSSARVLPEVSEEDKIYEIANPVSPLYDIGYLALDATSDKLAFASGTKRIYRPVIPEQLFLQPGIDVFKFLLENRHNLNYEPQIAQFTEYTATMNVTTDSFAPEISRGNTVALKIMPSLNIVNGNMYMITDRTRGCILRYCTDQGDSYLCRSKHPDTFADMIIDKELVTSVWAVVGALKLY